MGNFIHIKYIIHLFVTQSWGVMTNPPNSNTNELARGVKKRAGRVQHPQQFEHWVSAPGALAPPRTAEGRAGGGCGRGSLPPAAGVWGCYPRKFFEILNAKSCILAHFWSENGLLQGCNNILYIN
jgi:hypothetical protein